LNATVSASGCPAPDFGGARLGGATHPFGAAAGLTHAGCVRPLSLADGAAGTGSLTVPPGGAGSPRLAAVLPASGTGAVRVCSTAARPAGPGREPAGPGFAGSANARPSARAADLAPKRSELRVAPESSRCGRNEETNSWPHLAAATHRKAPR
jgi:hypothetical protein